MTATAPDLTPLPPSRPGMSHNSTSSPERVTRPGLINCELGTTQPLHLGAPRDGEGRQAEGAAERTGEGGCGVRRGRGGREVRAAERSDKERGRAGGKTVGKTERERVSNLFRHSPTLDTFALQSARSLSPLISYCSTIRRHEKPREAAARH